MRVGVVATSHKAINNLLAAIDEAADEAGATFRGWKKAADADDDDYDSDRVDCAKKPPDGGRRADPADRRRRRGTGPRRTSAAPSTCCSSTRPGRCRSPTRSRSPRAPRASCCSAIPQQLAHVSQGTHPLGQRRVRARAPARRPRHDPAGPRRLPRHVVAHAPRRLRLRLAARCTTAALALGRRPASASASTRPGLAGAGCACSASSTSTTAVARPRRPTAIADQVERLLDGGTLDRPRRRRRQLTLDDILVVAPYNAQVRCLRSALPDGARVGTVDKFQGQEAPVVFFSMAASTGEDVPRGMSFLFSRNRLNVAVSRAQALGVVVCSPRLLSARCSTRRRHAPRQHAVPGAGRCVA